MINRRGADIMIEMEGEERALVLLLHKFVLFLDFLPPTFAFK